MSEDIRINVGLNVDSANVRRGAQTIAQETQNAVSQYMGTLAQNASRSNNPAGIALSSAMGNNMQSFQTASTNLYNTMNILKSKIFLVAGSAIAAVAAFEKLDNYIKHTMFGTDQIVRESYRLEDCRLAIMRIQMDYLQRQLDIANKFTAAMNAASLIVSEAEREHAQKIAQSQKDHEDEIAAIKRKREEDRKLAANSLEGIEARTARTSKV